MVDIFPVFAFSGRLVFTPYSWNWRPVSFCCGCQVAYCGLSRHWQVSFREYLTGDGIGRELDDRVNIVLLRSLVFLFKSACSAFMCDDVVLSFNLYADGLHRAVTGSQAIAWVNVYVFTPETLRTVVSVPASEYEKTTPFTREVLYGAFEFF